MSDTPHCPDCGNPLEVEQWSEELCPHCLLQLALEQSPGPGLDGEETGTQERNTQGLAQGKILGNRYGIRNLLGRGGMGEVWRAYDLKLRVDVALKTVRPDIAQQERVLQTLHQEVRAAGEVISPNVCRFRVEGVDLSISSLISLGEAQLAAGYQQAAIASYRRSLELNPANANAAKVLAEIG